MRPAPPRNKCCNEKSVTLAGELFDANTGQGYLISGTPMFLIWAV
jgi:hypothetical protein